jgi:poly-gamma-glutamate synthesis protein (capsule biosynthesis protein)
MLGRGIDQLFAQAYMEMAERSHGPIPRPVDPAYPWGAAMAAMAALGPLLLPWPR